jgi:hypothetical protein
MTSWDRRLQQKMDPDLPWAPPAPKELRVDIDSIDEFAKHLKKENAELLGPGVAQLESGLRGGVHFGVGTPSKDVDLVKDRYLEAARRNMELGKQYVLATEILIDAAERIARRFRDADALSEAQVRDVEGMLTKATVDAVAVHEAANKAEADQLRQDDLERRRHLFGGAGGL